MWNLLQFNGQFFDVAAGWVVSGLVLAYICAEVYHCDLSLVLKLQANKLCNIELC